jgi:hypothetical protein
MKTVNMDHIKRHYFMSSWRRAELVDGKVTVSIFHVR